MSLNHAALMFIAAFLAGVVNSIAGGGMLLVFPMMIWLGVDPKIANATCTVAPRFDSGTLTAAVMRGGATMHVVITFTACGQYTVTRS